MLLCLATHSPSVLVQLLKIIRYTYHHQVAWVQVLLFIINICIFLTNWPTNWALGALANVHITTKSQSFTLSWGQGKGHTVAILIHKVCHTLLFTPHIMCYAVDMTLHGNHSDSDSDSDREQKEWVSIQQQCLLGKEELRGCDMEDESHSSA